ncbi:hypothetical protein ACHAQK_011278, partial [Fusarium lateritium]
TSIESGAQGNRGRESGSLPVTDATSSGTLARYRGQPSPELISLQIMSDSETEDELERPVTPGEPSIPIDHTAAASLILKWQSIRNITDPYVEREGINHFSEYHINQEKNRDILTSHENCQDYRQSQQKREMKSSGELNMIDSTPNHVTRSRSTDSLQPKGHANTGEKYHDSPSFIFGGNADFSEAK